MANITTIVDLVGERVEFAVLCTHSYSLLPPFFSFNYVSVSFVVPFGVCDLTTRAAFLNLLSHQDGGQSHQADSIID